MLTKRNRSELLHSCKEVKKLSGEALSRLSRCIRRLSMERDCAESQSQQYRLLVLMPNLLRLVLRTQPRSWPTAKFTDNLWMHWAVRVLM